MQITLNIQRQKSANAIVFDARTNLIQINCGNPIDVRVEFVSVSDDYTALCGNTTTYWQVLADCFKHNFKITAVNGSLLRQPLQPFNQPYLTNLTGNIIFTIQPVTLVAKSLA